MYFHGNFHVSCHFSAPLTIPMQESGGKLSNMSGNYRSLWYILRDVSENGGMLEWKVNISGTATAREILFFNDPFINRFYSVPNGCDFWLSFLKKPSSLWAYLKMRISPKLKETENCAFFLIFLIVIY